jgi:hypothetical protein
MIVAAATGWAILSFMAVIRDESVGNSAIDRRPAGDPAYRTNGRRSGALSDDPPPRPRAGIRIATSRNTGRPEDGRCCHDAAGPAIRILLPETPP